MQEFEPTSEPDSISKDQEEFESPKNAQIPERISRGIICNAGESVREMWSSENLENDSLDDYIVKMRESSGHFAFHGIARADLVISCIMRGFIRATGQEETPPKGYTAAISNAAHFSVDNVYWGRRGHVGFFCSAEALLENKSFIDSPIGANGEPNEDWPTAGFSDDPNDKSHRYSFDGLGIVFIPKTIKVGSDVVTEELTEWEDGLRKECQKIDKQHGTKIEEEFFEMGNIRLLPNEVKTEAIFNKIFEIIGNGPKRVYYYEGNCLEDGVNDFLSKNNLETRKPEIKVSRDIKLDRKSPTGETHGGAGLGDYYAVK